MFLMTMLLLIPQRYEFSSKSQRESRHIGKFIGCCWYHKGTNFQANHNSNVLYVFHLRLLLIPQRYEFSSKSQRYGRSSLKVCSCCWYHKGTNFQANHNTSKDVLRPIFVVADTTKVRIFKQITTDIKCVNDFSLLLLIPQRYEFSSKSQPIQCSVNVTLVVADTTKVRIFKQITTYRGHALI